MAKTKRELILFACFISGAGCIFNFVSLGTQAWVVSESTLSATLERASYSADTIQYGLFAGFHRQIEPLPRVLLLDMTCSISKNKCALICGDSNYRSAMLDTLISNDVVDTNNTVDTSCITTALTSRDYSMTVRDTHLREVYTVDHTFINAGVRNSTIAFLIIAALFGLLAAILALWNTIMNPIQFIFSIFGIYLCNVIGFCCTLLAMILWGAMFSTTLTKNVGYFMTILNILKSNDNTTLGYSYWLMIPAMSLYAGSIVVLFIRQILMDRNPKQVNVHLEGPADPAIYLF